MNSQTQGPRTLERISVMMFLQFFAWGSWFATVNLAFGSNGLVDFIGAAYESAPLAAILAPLFLGVVADRFFASERVMGALLIVGAFLMGWIAYLAPQGVEQGPLIVRLMLAYMCCYMPTLGLGNTITFTHLPQESFPKVRVWGTIGWIVAGLAVGFAGWSASLNIFWIASVVSLILGVYCFSLPHTPAPSKGEKLNVRSLLMLDALSLLKKPSFAVFALCSTLICIPLAYYYGQTGTFLGEAGFHEASATMTIGQMSEIIFMMLIPFFFRKLGVKWMLFIGMLSWVLRYALFAFGAPDQVAWMLLLGVALHGICYDFFFVTGFIYTDKNAPKEIRGQAQGLLVFLTQGIGMFFGFRFAFGGTFPFTDFKLPNKIGDYGSASGGEVAAQLDSLNEGLAEKGTLEKLGSLFAKGYPEGVDEALVTKAMELWKLYWIFPMILAGAIALLFLVTFRDEVSEE